MERNPLFEILKSIEARKQQEKMTKAGQMAADCIKPIEDPRIKQTLLWCLISGLLYSFNDDMEWNEMVEAAGIPCGVDGCDCHIHGMEFYQDLDKHRQIIMDRAEKIKKEMEQEKENENFKL